MAKNRNLPTQVKISALAIALLQLLDILVHISMDQLEILRIAASMMVLVWLGIFLSGSSITRALTAALSALLVSLQKSLPRP